MCRVQRTRVKRRGDCERRLRKIGRGLFYRIPRHLLPGNTPCCNGSQAITTKPKVKYGFKVSRC